ncbi:putative membrane protein [Pseudorhizobium tarimense]|uniref:Membrane protein n=1 Tax=Pseudorhizobium tarimense TaxID=1079109 RepID=A0ABV2HDS8_9HYPH|nr:DUF2254 family protein [Pseudorhizobium tarimense]MCJ8520978.1 DUF2254 domain-containing protein [Pseudorhizobium tarimense]MCJ8521041.1 DUF2254 domain-containing protein [Pseudorhizobium tarimense]
MAGSARHALWSNFWALPSLMILGTVLFTVGLLILDGQGASAWVGEWGWPLSIPGKTALELASGLVTVHTAFATLYFSITLLVLTLASSNLGVRLIDRWIGDRKIRFTLGLLLALLSSALIVLSSVDSEGPPERVPRLTLAVLTVATILALAWMTRALNHLGRTVHIDTSIAQLGRNAARSLSRNRHAEPPNLDLQGSIPIRAAETGYIDEIKCDKILDEACARGAAVRLLRGTGDFMMEGEEIGTVMGYASSDWVTPHIIAASYRNDTRGPVFEANLLVEIASRALSPAVNDFYTALACCDRLASMFAVALNVSHTPQWLTDKNAMPRLELPTEKVTQFMDGPMKAFRQTAAPYPAVIIHMIKLMARLPCSSESEREVVEFLWSHTQAMAEHGASQAQTDADRADIRAALESARHLLTAS